MPKVIEEFKPINVTLLKSLTDIADSHGCVNHEDINDDHEGVEAGAVLQLTTFPNQNYYCLGWFNERGSGTSFYHVNIDYNNFIEGIDFIFN